MVKKAFTLIEALIVIVILSILTVGAFKVIAKIYQRNFIASTVSEFEQKSQQSLDFLSGMLYYRIPLTMIGYKINGDFKYIGDIESDENYTIFEWIGECKECKVDRNLSGFLDLEESNRDTNTVVALDFNRDFINSILDDKFGISLNDAGIIFAGSFDRGEEGSLYDYNDSFGWHGHKHKYIATITNSSTNGDDTNLTINYEGERVYEKFYLVDSAYAVALKKDLNQSLLSQCKDLNLSKLPDNTLLLFYNYRPWEGDTFCADNHGNYDGNVSVLAFNVKDIKFRLIGSHLELLIRMQNIKDDINITVTKQKVVF